MIYQTFDMEAVNAVLTHPDIWEEIGGGELTELPYVPCCLYFLMDGGVIIFHPYGDGMKIHANVIPEKRGKHAYDAVEQSIQEMFRRGHRNIYAEIDVNLRHVYRFAKHLGFRLLHRGERDVLIRRRWDA